MPTETATIRNMRYPIEIILNLLSAGMSIEEILEDYPYLEKSERPAVAVPKQKIFWCVSSLPKRLSG